MMKALIDRLRARWFSLTSSCRDDNGSDRCIEGLIASYSEPHRAYHTLAHLDFVFAMLDAHAAKAREPARLAFACWYHDVIYDPRAADNEARSAERATEELTAIGVMPDVVKRIDRLIRATATHQTADADSDDALFLDADFSILGAAPEIYAAYVKGVRFEYGHVDDAGWKAGRGAFLKKALAAGRLFRTDVFETAYGAQARANVTAELKALG
ncbi:MAG: hypothetical protein QM698_03275 [Micropepsaceae bacterium]